VPGMSRRSFVRAGIGAAGVLVLTGGTGHYVVQRLNAVAAFDADSLRALRAGGSTHLFERFPGLADRIPWRPIGRLDTRVEALPQLDGAGDVRLFIKRDDLTSDLYGGNKVRKLEHSLADAALRERRTIITLGAAGTNHGLATALHSRALGFDVKLALFDQPDSAYVRRNLRGVAHTGAEVRYSGGEAGALYRAHRFYQDETAAGGTPYFIMIGGSSRLGTIAFINAALELAAQVRAGTLPEPDRIFVALGTCSTAAGLAAGCALAGMRTRVSAVRVASPLFAQAATVRYFANDALRFLQRQDPGVPRIRIGFGDYDVVTNQLGDGYGHTTSQGLEALEWIAPRVSLEPVYTAKALAACLDYCRRSARPGENVLYWHTANAAPVPQAQDAGSLPPALRARLVG
jgi:1-aminocyclopropane-1-carboxylate deaminase/D-cysteine desulfhydrase-like pyridoxal-dependent ACC family enzyme